MLREPHRKTLDDHEAPWVQPIMAAILNIFKSDIMGYGAPPHPGTGGAAISARAVTAAAVDGTASDPP